LALGALAASRPYYGGNDYGAYGGFDHGSQFTKSV